MRELTSAEIQDTLAPLVMKAGLSPVSMEVTSEEPPFDTLPTLSIIVPLDKVGPDETHDMGIKLGKLIDKVYGGEARVGYYSQEIGFDDIPRGHARIDVDLLPFALLPDAPSP